MILVSMLSNHEISHSLARLETLVGQDQPFFLEIAPATPHNRGQGEPTIPLARHKYDFAHVKAPRLPNYNPIEKFQRGKSSWIREMPRMDQKLHALADESMKSRIRGLQGIDELVEDVVAFLDKHDVLDNTYSMLPTRPFGYTAKLCQSYTRPTTASTSAATDSQLERVCHILRTLTCPSSSEVQVFQ